MLQTHRFLAGTALALALVAATASAQGFASRPAVNPYMAQAGFPQGAYNAAIIGQAYQAAASPFAAGPALAASPFGGLNPYALSTTGGYNPYLGSSGSPYSLSTNPGASASPYGSPYGSGGYAGGFLPYPGFGDPYGGALQGEAALTRAAGKYFKDIQEARISRETSRQMELETTKRRIELARWIDATRPTAQQLRDREFAAELDRARKDSTDVEIASGRALNTLLASIQRVGSLNRGPNVELEEDNLKRVNLAGNGSLGNVGMLRELKKLSWPEALQAAGYDKPRTELVKLLSDAVLVVKERDPVPDGKLKDMRAFYQMMSERLDDSPDELSPAQYIEARRFLNGLKQAIRALGDKNIGKYFNNTWTAQGKNVAELVAHMNKEGLSFAPSAPGDAAAYKALYLAMRQFEAGLTTVQK